jgi:signal peptidase I
LEAELNNFDRIGCALVAESVRAGHEVRLRVNGSSMLPSIWPGDALTVRPLGDATAAEGQVILFTREGRLVAHRVVGRLESASSTQLITRGDAHDHCDPPVAASEILGTVASISRGGREIPMASPATQKLLSFGIRHSDLIRRAALKIHSIRRRSWTD